MPKVIFFAQDHDASCNYMVSLLLSYFTMVFLYDEQVIKRIGEEILEKRTQSEKTLDRTFNEFFGGGWSKIYIVWQLIVGCWDAPKDLHPKHLYWALLQIKLYATEGVLAKIAQVDAKTFCKWSRQVRVLMSHVVH